MDSIDFNKLRQIIKAFPVFVANIGRCRNNSNGNSAFFLERACFSPYLCIRKIKQ